MPQWNQAKLSPFILRAAVYQESAEEKFQGGSCLPVHIEVEEYKIPRGKSWSS